MLNEQSWYPTTWALMFRSILDLKPQMEKIPNQGGTATVYSMIISGDNKSGVTCQDVNQWGNRGNTTGTSVLLHISVAQKWEWNTVTHQYKTGIALSVIKSGNQIRRTLGHGGKGLSFCTWGRWAKVFFIFSSKRDYFIFFSRNSLQLKMVR